MKKESFAYKLLIKYQLLFVLLVALDQISKIIAVKLLGDGHSVEIFSWLKLVLVINDGVAFSFLSGTPQWISALISIVATIAIEYFILIKKSDDKIFMICLTVLAAGAFGNGIDRWLAVFGKEFIIKGISYSGVVDFIFPTFFANFNVADIYVTCSCIFMIAYFIFSKDDDNEPSIFELRKANKKLKEIEKTKGTTNDN